MKGYLFCIGAAKAGTTWLYQQLGNSTDCYFAPEKELNYFFSRYGDFNRLYGADRFVKLKAFVDNASNNFRMRLPEAEYARRFSFFQRNLDWYENFAKGPVSDSWYRSLFRDAGPKQFACDFSPSTSKISQDGIAALRDLHENVKLVYVMREPFDRLWSHVKFHAMWMNRYDEVMAMSNDEIVRFVRQFDLLSDGMYGANLSRFLEVFRPEDILFLNFDDIKSNPFGVFDQVAAFLGIDPPKGNGDVAAAVNVSSSKALDRSALEVFKPEILADLRLLEKHGFAPARAWAAQVSR